MRLRQKIILLIVPVIVIPMIISGWVSYSQLRVTAIEKSKEQMGTLLEQYALYADSLIHGAESNIRLFSNNELLRRYMVTQSEEERYEILQPLLMKQLQSYQKAYPLYYEFRLIFPDGFEDLRLVNRAVENITMDEFSTPFIKTILEHNEGVFSRVQSNPDNGELVLYVAIALNLKDRSIESATSTPKFRGYLVLTIDISEVLQQMGLSKLGADGFIFTANSSGEMELFPERLESVLRGNSVSQKQMAGLMVDAAVTDVVGGVDLSELPIIETRFLGNNGFMKGVKIHEDFILFTWLPFNEINQKTQELGLIVIGMTLVAVIVTVLLLFSLLNHFVLSPIQKLRSAAIEIGRGVLTTAINVSHNDEVGDLAKSFDEMRKNTQRSHENLERLVDERTIEVRQALETVEKSSQAKSNFLSRMSHELRTPLNAILGFSQLYSYDKSLSEHQKTNAREINNAGEHLLTLIDEVLDLSKIEAGHLEVSLETISLARVMSNCCVLTSALADAHSVSIELENEQCEDIYAYADKVRIKQVFLNLMSNAVKYNQEHGRVIIYCDRVDDEIIRINFKDTGVGIPPHKMSQLFEPFNRMGAESSGTEGTGIGLVITKQLVELMGGRLGVESSPGMGSTFWVELKASSSGEAEHCIDDKDELFMDGTACSVPVDHVKILVAEDNMTNQEVLRQQLSLLGYSADFANNGIEALEQWRSGNYHLLMTDIHMPKMDGYGLVDSIHKTRQYAESRVPIIAITADAMQGQAQQCLDAGMDDYVAKPVHIEDLKHIINKWLPQQAVKQTLDNKQLLNGSLDQNPAGVTDSIISVPIDRSMLTRVIGDDPVKHHRLLQSFVASTPEILQDIQGAFCQYDAIDLMEQAHKLKSSARSMGANQMSDLCEALEAAAITQQWAEVKLLVPRLDSSYKEVEQYTLENFMQG